MWPQHQPKIQEILFIQCNSCLAMIYFQTSLTRPQRKAINSSKSNKPFPDVSIGETNCYLYMHCTHMTQLSSDRWTQSLVYALLFIYKCQTDSLFSFKVSVWKWIPSDGTNMAIRTHLIAGCVCKSFNSFLILYLSLVKVSVSERLDGFSLAILMKESWVCSLSFLYFLCYYFSPQTGFFKHQSSTGRSNVVVYWSEYVLISVCMCMQWADRDGLVGADVIARQEGFMVRQSNDGIAGLLKGMGHK